jgi:hypothetical protein
MNLTAGDMINSNVQSLTSRPMVTEDEKKFIEYWEANRDFKSKFLVQLISGIPVGIFFSVPVLIVLYTGRFWYKRADMLINTQLNPLLMGAAIFIIAVFVAVFYKRHQWEMNEQQYLEFKNKEKRQAP